MSTYDKETKFYWMQLREDFFDEDAIEWLEEQKPKGKEYAYFYLKLCSKALKSNGILVRKVGKLLLPYDNEKLAELTKIDFDTVTVAMELLIHIGLVEILENGEIYLTQLEHLIGSKSLGAFKKQQQRLLGGQMSAKCPPKIESELELEDGWIDINNYLNNKEPIQNITSKYNEIFKCKQIYFENFECIPERLKNQIKLYQIAVKNLVDAGQLEILESVNLKTMEKIFRQILKAKNVSNLDEYFIASLCNEVAKEDR